MTDISIHTSINHRIETLLTGEDVAKILNVSRAQAYILMRKGEIPTVRIGRTVRVRPADLDAFINSKLV